MPKIFEQIGISSPKKSAFDLSREKKLSCEMGNLIPVYLEEVVPGDQFSVKSEIMMRLAPMVSPVMHRVNVYMHYFFVPNRIVWNEWEDFITGGQEGDSNPVFPTFNAATVQGASPGGLSDYMGIPPDAGGATTSNLQISQLPYRAYVEIWNEYYRDETLQDRVDVQAGIPGDLAPIRQRCWEKDYFTSALPWAQRGPDVEVPLNVKYKDRSEIFNIEGDPSEADSALETSPTQIGPGGGREITTADNVAARIENLDELSGIDINELRTSSALQRWFEKQARGGYRYIETILSHFGIRTSDHRLQRPEYLGGGRQPIVISEVLNTSATDTQAQGSMSGHGLAIGDRNTFKEQFEEHGYVMGIMSVLPRTAYQQGIHRHWSRKEKHDFYWPEFAHLGEQEIKNKELYWDPEDADDAENEATFGYQQRYAEMKYGCSTVHGDFRENLDFWHMGRIFENQPQLNEEFVRSNPTNRIFAVEDGDHLWVQVYHDVKARRPMPFFADPR